MDARQTFKRDVIAQCIQAGLTQPAEISAFLKSAMIKLADESGIGRIPLVSSAVESVGSGIKNTIGALSSWAIPTAIAAPPLLGAVAGSMLGRGTDIDDYDVEEAKQQEVIDEYKRLTAQSKRRALVEQRRVAAAGQRKGRSFF